METTFRKDPLTPSEYTLLLASGDAKLRGNIKMDLVRAGYSVRVFCNIQTTLIAMQTKKPHLLIVDDDLPVEGAAETVYQLYCLREMYRFPVMIMSRHGNCVPLWMTELGIRGAVTGYTMPFMDGEAVWLVNHVMRAIIKDAFPAPSPISYEEFLASQQPYGWRRV